MTETTIALPAKVANHLIQEARAEPVIGLRGSPAEVGMVIELVGHAADLITVVVAAGQVGYAVRRIHAWMSSQRDLPNEVHLHIVSGDKELRVDASGDIGEVLRSLGLD